MQHHNAVCIAAFFYFCSRLKAGMCFRVIVQRITLICDSAYSVKMRTPFAIGHHHFGNTKRPLHSSSSASGSGNSPSASITADSSTWGSSPCAAACAIICI